ncbi:MAG: insulinase family protein, partial [Armatimonadetes bacterium]|nr:insulinase family protein [Armatimonadota bacterium]
YVLGATFPEEQVANQIDVVTREIARVDDDPRRAAIELFSQTMFRRHPERYRIIGYPARFNELTREDLVKFHRAYYTPDNLVATAVGDFDAEEIADRLAAVLSQYQRRPGPPIVLPDEAAPTTIRRASREREGLHRAHLLLGWRTVDLFHPDLYALDVLAYVLGHGDSARLPRLLRDELGLVDVVNVWSDTPAYGAGSFIVSATLDSANREKVEQQILQVTEGLTSELVGEEELQRAKRQKEAVFVYAQETAAGRAGILGTDLLLTGDLGFSNKYLDGIRAVTALQVREVARKYLLPDRYAVTSLVPAAKEAESATVDERRTPVPRTKKYVLDNGLTVLIRAEPGAAAVHIATATRAGLRYEDEQTNGITRLMARMLLRGTEHRSRNEITEGIDSLGADIEAYSGRNSFGLTAYCLPDDCVKILDILADCLQNPTFPEQEFGRLQQLTLAGLAARREDVDNVAEKLLRATLFEHHPYQFSELGTPSSVQQLSAEQVDQFYRRVCG